MSRKAWQRVTRARPSPERVLVLGSTGMVGRAWCQLLSRLGTAHTGVHRPDFDLADPGSIDRALSGDYDLGVQADATVTGSAIDDQLGTALALGDFTGDGSAEVFVGAPFADPNSTSGAGMMYGFTSVSSMLGDYDAATDRSIEVYGESVSSYVGASLGVSDLDGDGSLELHIGATNEATGAAAALLGATVEGRAPAP